jgi:hypothetical protein
MVGAEDLLDLPWAGAAAGVAAAVFAEVAGPAFPVPAGAAVAGALEVVAALVLVLALPCATAA